MEGFADSGWSDEEYDFSWLLLLVLVAGPASEGITDVAHSSECKNEIFNRLRSITIIVQHLFRMRDRHVDPTVYWSTNPDNSE